MKKLVLVADIPLKTVFTIKRSTIAKHIKTTLYDLYKEGNFVEYHDLTQIALRAMQTVEAMREAFIDGYTAVLLGGDLMLTIDKMIGADANFELSVTNDEGTEMARFDSSDLNY
jgi:hypothetical protein